MNVDTNQLVTFKDVVTLRAGTGGAGGTAGDGTTGPLSGTPNVGGAQPGFSSGGDGGNIDSGGAGGRGGNNDLNIVAPLASFENNINVLADDGGQADVGADSDGGQGGYSKTTITGNAQLVGAAGQTLALTSGKGGTKTNAATDGGTGGDAAFTVSQNLDIKTDSILDLTKGAQNNAAASSALVLTVHDTMKIDQGKDLTMRFNYTTGDAFNAGDGDNIEYGVLELEKGSTVDAFLTGDLLNADGTVNQAGVTSGVVGTIGTDDIGDASGAETVNYLVGDLIVHTNATWLINGTYAPNTAAPNAVTGNTATFDMTDIKLWGHQGVPMLTMTGTKNSVGNNGSFGLANWFRYDAGLRAYYWDLWVDSDAANDPLKATNFKTADGYRTYLQGSLAGIATLNDSFWNATLPMIGAAAEAPLDTTVLTMKMGGSSIESDTGSNIDVDAFSVSLGLSRKFETAIGHTTLGLMAEYGDGSYDTHTSVSWLGRLQGDGDVSHFGGGLFFHNDFLQGTYVEASLRAGGIDNDYELRRDSRFNRPYNHNWDTSGSYFGVHLGLGHKFEVSDLTLIDLYGKVLWTRTASESVRTDFGERYEVDAINSIRSRLGGRLTQSNCAGTIKGYVGLAWEHEFDGEAEGYISGAGTRKDRITDAPELQGSSGFGELGLTYAPEEGMYTIDLGLFGLAGKREGFGGTLGLKFEF